MTTAYTSGPGPGVGNGLPLVDTGTGSVWKVSLSSKAKRLVATLKPGLDNLAFDSRGRLFVTSMTDNGIYLVDKVTGAAKTIVEGKLAIPGDLAVVSENGKDTVHVADVFSYRTVDGGTDTASFTQTVLVTPVNDAPAGATLTANSVAENSANGTVIGTIAGQDPDAGQTFSFVLQDAHCRRLIFHRHTSVDD